MTYTLKDDLRSIDFHDSILTGAELAGDTLTLTFRRAVIIGHSCPELESHIPCPLNDGEDRYAAAELVLRLEKVQDLTVLSQSRLLFRTLVPGQLPGFFQTIRENPLQNHVNGLSLEGSGVLTLNFWLQPHGKFYELTCTPGSFTAGWDAYGKIAWYVEHHRKKYPVRPVYGAIDGESLRSYTLLRDLLPAMEPVLKAYNWLVTDCVCNTVNRIADRIERMGYCWMTGDELVEFAKTDSTQFIGGVFSGFSKDTAPERVLEEELPVWEQPGFWYEPLNLQHPLARVELVPWDSTYVLALSRDKDVIDRFRAALPKSEDLTNYIHSREEGKR